ncbi:trypsin beta-like [Drosophila elegans]|uniref:trypsin beta-like n=1 Tax=Drosophila elegans TaxID=30023 RepID=UPI0007E85789|nr:trypsin beta-like [Drosophila elegans]
MYFECLISLTSFVLLSAARIPGPEERIVGGYNIPIKDVPWQVSLLNNGVHDCGGIIYSDRVILTAAHCLEGVNLQKFWIRAGSPIWSKGGQLVKVQKAIPHEHYKSKSLPNDVAVLILRSPLKFDANVKKIALADTTPKAGTMSLVSGWGYTTDKGVTSPILKGVNVAVVSQTDCKKAYGNSIITKDMICAWAPGKDACTFDSGGPLISLPDRKLIGIVSFGGVCASNIPGVYADVAFFRNWIIDTIKKNI